MLVCVVRSAVYVSITVYFPFAGTSDYSTTSGPSSTPSQSSTIHSSVSFTIFTPSSLPSATPALSARPTTSVHYSSVTTTCPPYPVSTQSLVKQYYSTVKSINKYFKLPSLSPACVALLCCHLILAGTSANATTSGLTLTSSPSPSPTPGGVPVDPDSYVLPAAISAAAVLLVTVLTAIFVVVICIITRRHKTRKSLDMQRLSSILYQSTQSDVTFKDNQFHTDKNGEVPIFDANGTVDKDLSGEIRETPFNYADLGPSESNDSVFQGAAEEPVAEGAISRPTSQASFAQTRSPPSLHTEWLPGCIPAC